MTSIRAMIYLCDAPDCDATWLWDTRQSNGKSVYFDALLAQDRLDICTTTD